ncbi:diguanylate cyclase/phosphodiesterase (GGDEF & EAL domains) with PAS/PAC sensor(s) (plasmid) [Acidisarcina polymorpha]|uniref:Diguanylate cyclase/phosphodiesterase (GGDEF & EAL domains) with PAS/PAC sensor(S) n=1 Tax=Acidisarcina polymorpha TaxID=2211140 RepID=A0A2Z5GA53_9BACT|nr:diguanylate cyclase/phosphodiesterase (GGDEF & EAL domains) with PAS/PAC sensor(s) [Acidisarcina polymorpha]
MPEPRNQLLRAKVEKCECDLRTAETSLAKAEAALRIASGQLELARASALHDPLTKLANRQLFDEKLANAIAVAGRHQWSLAVMFLDLDSFKAINDTQGHAGGDIALRETAHRLMQGCRKEDTICRNGGDEFLYLLIDPQNRDNIERVLVKATERIGSPLEVNEQRLTISLSVGIAIYPEDGVTGEQLIRNADSAMYQAKIRNSGWCFFGEPMRQSESASDR